MTLTELRTFLTILETGSLIAAADRLNVTQSTVTARLKSLEQQLGQDLIIRRKSGAVASPAGQRLKRYAGTISDLWRQAQQETALPKGMGAICNMSIETDLWVGLGEHLHQLVLTLDPPVAMSVWEGDATTIAGWLQSEKSDLALTYTPRTGADQTQFELPADDLILVSTNPDSPLRFDPGYVFVEAGYEFGRNHAAAYADANAARIAFGSARLGLDHILTHGGSAYLPRRIAQPHLNTGKLHAVPDAPVFHRPIYLVINRRAQNAWAWFDQVLQKLKPKAA